MAGRQAYLIFVISFTQAGFSNSNRALTNEQVEIVLHSKTISCSWCTSRFLTTLLGRRGRTGLTSASFLLGPKVNLELIYDLGVLSD